MAVTLVELSAALRIGDGVEAPGEPIAGILTRLLGVSEALVEIDSPEAPELVKDESIIRIAAYLYDMPTAGIGDRYARAVRSSGAAGLLSKWRVLRVVGGGDPNDVHPSGGGGADQTARDAAADAQTTADAAQADIDDHELNHPGGGGGVLTVIDGRLPAAPVAMRIAWSLPNAAINAATFGADSAVGTTLETISPTYPQAFRDAGVDSAILVFWAATDLEPAELPLDTGDVGTQSTALQIDGVNGLYWSTVDPVSRFFQDIPFSLVFPGELIASQPWATQQDTEQTAAIATMIADAIAAIPAPTGGGGLPTAMAGQNLSLALGANMFADSGIAIPSTDYFWIEIFIGAQGGVLNLHRMATYIGADAVTHVGNAPTPADRVRGDTRSSIAHNFGRLGNGNLAVAAGTAATYSLRVWT